MPKKTSARSRKVSKKTVARRAPARKNESFINWTHEHPLYFLIAVAGALLVLLFTYKLISVRDESDALIQMNEQNIMNTHMAMPKVSPSQAPGMGY